MYLVVGVGLTSIGVQVDSLDSGSAHKIEFDVEVAAPWAWDVSQITSLLAWYFQACNSDIAIG